MMEQFKALAIAAYPNEAGAVVINGTLYPVRNASVEPTRYMEFDALELGMLELKHGKVEAYIHSHPFDSSKPPIDHHYQPQWASHRDMEMWIALNVPFGIVATDGASCSDILWYDDNNRAPLEGRTFVHGLHDCYSIVRDYYHQTLGINLKNFPRGWGWWNDGQNLYLDGFGEAGFVEVPRHEAQVNDVIIYKIGTAYPNHAAVMIGQDAILHHLIDRQSRVEQKSRWARHEALVVRYVGLDKYGITAGSIDDETNLPARSAS